LYPGKSPGRQSLKIERLQINRRYAVTGAATDTVVADSNGIASIDVDLNGRTPVSIKPV
jgi:pyrrolidone-carboxylate peptidase